MDWLIGLAVFAGAAWLAHASGASDGYNKGLKKAEEKAQNLFSDRVKEIEKIKLESLKKIEYEKAKLNADKKLFANMFAEKTIGFPWVANLFGKYREELIAQKAIILESKKNPAVKAADELKQMKSILREAEIKSRILEGQLKFYESIFPWIEDFKDLPDEMLSAKREGRDTLQEDSAREYLAPGEWEKLGRVEKLQKALDRYRSRKKSNWEIGRDLERYVGYQYEINDFDVVYFGAVKGFEDLGRDIIAQYKDEVFIVQCKYWSKEKIIHEKHLFQLYGTSILYSIDNKEKEIQPIFVTTCKLSDIANKVADALSIGVKENFIIENYPLIKCNINKNREKIYHLPFDQQYDKVKIVRSKGEFYSSTIVEAEAAGFRRALRWLGE